MSAAAPSLRNPIDRTALRRRALAAWSCGDGAVIESGSAIVAEQLVETADLRAGERVLDLCGGSGNAALAAARRYARVTCIDQVPSLLDRGRERARAESLPVAFETADAEALPYADASFDLVLSTFGAMYVLDADAAAREMRRVLAPGGRIALASWTRRGLVGRLLALLDAHAPQPEPRAAATRWGARAYLAARFGVQPQRIRCERRCFRFRYRSSAHWVQVFRDFHGPTHKAFGTLDAAGQHALEREIAALLDAANTAGPGSLTVAAEYLEAVIDFPAIPISRP